MLARRAPQHQRRRRSCRRKARSRPTRAPARQSRSERRVRISPALTSKGRTPLEQRAGLATNYRLTAGLPKLECTASCLGRPLVGSLACVLLLFPAAVRFGAVPDLFPFQDSCLFGDLGHNRSEVPRGPRRLHLTERGRPCGVTALKMGLSG